MEDLSSREALRRILRSGLMSSISSSSLRRYSMQSSLSVSRGIVMIYERISFVQYSWQLFEYFAKILICLRQLRDISESS